MGERADGDEVDAGIRIGANVFQDNASGYFKGNALFILLRASCGPWKWRFDREPAKADLRSRRN